MALARLNNTHRAVIDKLLRGDGTIEEIAVSVQKSKRTIHYWLKDPLFKKELEEREADFKRVQKARITQLASKALDTQEEIMGSSKNDKARADVASDVLDRAGYIKVKQSEIVDKTEERTGVVVLAEVIEESTDGEE